MATASVKLTWNNQKLAQIERNVLLGIVDMATDIETRARTNAPYLTGALSSSIRTVRVDDGRIVEVIAGGDVGGKSIKYALKREYGPNRNPATVHYMRNAMNQVMTGDYMAKYFGDITK